MKRYILVILSILLSCVLLLTGCTAKTQGESDAVPSAKVIDYPTSPIKLINPYTAGGVQDVVSRALAKYIKLEKPLVVTSVVGGAGKIGTEEVKTSKPDGYTLLSHSMAIVVGYHAGLFDKPAWQDLDPICSVTSEDNVIAVRNDSQWKTIGDLIDYTKKNPGKVKMAISGVGGLTHAIVASLQEKAGMKFSLVPFAGAADSRAALAGGHVDVVCVQISDVLDMTKTGEFRMLAISSEKRNKLLPDLQTLKENGIDVVFYNWRGIFAPKGTPKEVISKLESEFKKVTENQEFIKLMNDMTYDVQFKSSKDFVKSMEAEDKLIQPLAPLLKGKI